MICSRINLLILQTMFVLLFLYPWTAGAAAQTEAVGVTPGRPVMEIAPHAEYLLDKTDSLQYTDILSNHLPFQRHTKSSFQFSFTRATLWMKCRIAPASFETETPDKRLFLAFDNSALGSVTLWIPIVKDGKSETLQLAGGWLENGRRGEFSYLYPVFILPESIDSSRPVVVRVATPYALQFRATLYTADAFREYSFIVFLLIGFFVGILIAMILYNLVLYLFMRDKHYIYYILYVLFLLLWQGALFGLVRYFWPALGYLMLSYIAVFAALMMFFAVIFAVVFLKTSQTAPRHDKLLKGLAAFMMIIVVLVFLRQLWIGNLLAYLSGQAAAIVLFTSALSALRSGFKPALYYLIAVAVFLATVIIFIFKFYGLVPNNTLTMHIVIFGSAAEAILLSIALGYRIRMLREEEQVLRERERNLQAISITDELTGLFNRRFLNASLLKKTAAARRSGKGLSLLMMDVDHFKNFNDTYGHPEGDKVLVALGRLLLQMLREEDIACRYGGEEFVVILDNADLKIALDTAQRIRTGFENLPFRPGTKNDISVTVSIGAAEFKPEESPDELLFRADQAMYQAKQTGRNRVCSA